MHRETKGENECKVVERLDTTGDVRIGSEVVWLPRMR